MGHFFFHFCTESERHVDATGVELASVEAAYLQAVATAYSMAEELLVDGMDAGRCSFEIADANGTPLLTLPFAELLKTDRVKPRAELSTSSLALAIEHTLRRVTAAKRELANSMHDARTNIVEAQLLVRRLNAMNRVGGRQPSL